MAAAPRLQAIPTVARPATPGPAEEPPLPRSASPFDQLSRQALLLYAEVLVIDRLTGRTGCIPRREAERLAEECGALVDEIVDVGLWREAGLTYRI